MGRVETEIDTRRDLTIQTFHGEISAAELRATIHAYFQGQVTRKRLWNFQDASPAQLTGDEIRDLIRLSHQYSQHIPDGMVAMVFPSRLAYGIGTMFELARGVDMNRVDFKSFTNRDSALEWLAERKERQEREP